MNMGDKLDLFDSGALRRSLPIVGSALNFYHFPLAQSPPHVTKDRS